MPSEPGAGRAASSRVVLTRDPAQAGPLEAGLTASGFEVGFLPMTEQRLPEDAAELTTALADLRRGGFDGLLLTSGNTVRALLALGWEGEVPAETWVGVVGPGTARVLAELTGLREPWIPTGERSAAGLLEELQTSSEVPGRASGERILLPQSAQARPLLAEGLGSAGFRVVQMTAYETVPLVDDAGRLKRPGSPRRLLPTPDSGDVLGCEDLGTEDMLLVTSSSAASSYAALGERPPSRLLAIGEPTAETLRAQGVLPAAVLREPTAEGMAEALGRR